MKNLILIVFAFFALNSFAQEPPNTSLYSQGFRVGADLAKECTELSRRLYLATTGGDFPLEYLAGVNEGWAANIGACYGDAIESPHTGGFACVFLNHNLIHCFFNEPDGRNQP